MSTHRPPNPPCTNCGNSSQSGSTALADNGRPFCSAECAWSARFSAEKAAAAAAAAAAARNARDAVAAAQQHAEFLDNASGYHPSQAPETAQHDQSNLAHEAAGNPAVLNQQQRQQPSQSPLTPCPPQSLPAAIPSFPNAPSAASASASSSAQNARTSAAAPSPSPERPPVDPRRRQTRRRRRESHALFQYAIEVMGGMDS